MPVFNQEPKNVVEIGNKKVACFTLESENIDPETVKSFGEEWEKFTNFSDQELQVAGDQYFDIVDENILKPNSTILDLGCGSGRWSKYIATKVDQVEAVDPSEAVFHAAKLHQNIKNIRFSQAGVDNIPFKDESFDFVMSLGVLHHIPDTAKALQALVKKLKKEGYALIYLYYALDNRGFLFKLLFKSSAVFRAIISRLPGFLKRAVCDLIALFVYLPFVGIAKLVKLIIPGKAYMKVPLTYYRNKSWNIIRNDALDRFGTPLEQRFTKAQITEMLKQAGMVDIKFSENEPYWHVIAKKA